MPNLMAMFICIFLAGKYIFLGKIGLKQSKLPSYSGSWYVD